MFLVFSYVDHGRSLFTHSNLIIVYMYFIDDSSMLSTRSPCQTKPPAESARMKFAEPKRLKVFFHYVYARKYATPKSVE